MDIFWNNIPCQLPGPLFFSGLDHGSTQKKYLAHSSSTTCYQNFVYKLFDYKIEHLQPMQTSPITFMTIFEALRLILAPQHISYLILISLRILKWG